MRIRVSKEKLMKLEGAASADSWEQDMLAVQEKQGHLEVERLGPHDYKCMDEGLTEYVVNVAWLEDEDESN